MIGFVLQFPTVGSYFQTASAFIISKSFVKLDMQQCLVNSNEVGATNAFMSYYLQSLINGAKNFECAFFPQIAPRETINIIYVGEHLFIYRLL